MQPTTIDDATSGAQAKAARSSAARWGPLAGIGFAVLMLYTMLGPPAGPESGAPAAAFEEFMADAANRIWILAEVGTGTVAAVLFVAFMAGLRQRGSAPERGLSPFAFGCGLLFAMSLVATLAAWSVVPGGMLFGEQVPSGELIRFSLDLGKAFIGLAVPLCAGAFAVAVGFANRSSHVMPRWLGISGIVVGIVELVTGIFFLPLVLFPVWIAAVSFALLLRPTR